jgi:hypothetical protein
MRDMSGPEKTDVVIHTVKPVIHKIFKQDQDHPVQPGKGNAVGKPVIIEKRENNAYVYRPETKVKTGIKNIQVKILERILHCI